MNDPQPIHALFDRIAHRYDRMISTLSLRRHRQWKKKLIEIADIRPTHTVIDIATGTGDVACMIAPQLQHPHQIIGCDISIGMLKEAQKKAPTIQWAQCRAENLPFRSHSVDRILISFAFRFMQHDQVLSECHRILKTAGKLTILDTTPWPAPLRPLVRLFDYTIGSLVSLYHLQEARIYESMYDSIRNNISTEQIKAAITAASFRMTHCHSMALGTATLYQAIKI